MNIDRAVEEATKGTVKEVLHNATWNQIKFVIHRELSGSISKYKANTITCYIMHDKTVYIIDNATSGATCDVTWGALKDSRIIV